MSGEYAGVRLVREKSPGNHSCHAKPPRNTPLFQNTRCLAMIPGESGDSGHNPGLDGRAKIALSFPIHEQFLGGGKKSPQISIQA